MSPLAPLHNPPALSVVHACHMRLAHRPMVAVFDTAYFQELPDYVYSYALPQPWITQSHLIRRYGFHGLAHRSMAERYCAITGTDPESSRLITLQLGNGCSIADLRAGYPLESSMGFTPMEGLIMSTRPGDLDVGAVLHLHEMGISLDELNEGLNHKAGLLGLSGVSGDMKTLLELEAQRHSGARLALEAFVHRARKYLGAYLAVLNGADAIIFMKGYWNQPGETAAAFDPDGFLKTGDVATIDEAGFVRLIDRRKDVVLVSGFSVFPSEVEEVAVLYPGVLEAAAIGVPDDASGEAVKLFVVKKSPGLTAEALAAHCRSNLAAYKRPREIVFLDALPKTAVGKVLRRALREPMIDSAP